MHQNNSKHIKKLIFNKKNFKFFKNIIYTMFSNIKICVYIWKNFHHAYDNEGSHQLNKDMFTVIIYLFIFYLINKEKTNRFSGVAESEEAWIII